MLDDLWRQRCKSCGAPLNTVWIPLHILENIPETITDADMAKAHRTIVSDVVVNNRVANNAMTALSIILAFIKAWITCAPLFSNSSPGEAISSAPLFQSVIRLPQDFYFYFFFFKVSTFSCFATRVSCKVGDDVIIR